MNKLVLYLSDLHQDATEQNIKDIFSDLYKYELTVTILQRIGRPNGAKLYFENEEDGLNVLKNGQFRKIKNTPVQLEFSTEVVQYRKPDICLKNLDETVTTEDLHKLINSDFHIKKVSVLMNQECKSKRFGFLSLNNAEEVESVIEKFNNIDLNGKNLILEKYENKESDDFKTICVKNFNKNLEEKELKKMLNEYGNITKLVIKKDQNGESRGFAFVTFRTHEEALQAIQELNNKEIDNHIWKVEKERSRTMKRKCILKVQRFPVDIEEDYLWKLFGSYGPLNLVKILANKTQPELSYAYISFIHPYNALNAMKSLNFSEVMGNKIEISLM